MLLPVPDEEADGETQRELQKLGIEEASMTSDELIEDYCFDAIDNQTKAVYPKDYVDAAIAELKAENQRLVKCCKEYDSRQRIDERIKFNGAQQLRATKRALWLARATIAHSTKYKYHRLSYKAEIDPQPHSWSCYINGEVYRTGKMNRKLEPHYWIELWEDVERKCRAKAEEYK